MKSATKIALWISQSMFLLALIWLYKLVFYLHPIALGVVWFCLTAGIFLIVFWWKNEKLTITYRLFMFLFILYSLSLIILLFSRPQEQSYESWNFIPFATIWLFLAESRNLLVATYNLLANIGLFIPFGIFLMLHMDKWKLTREKLIWIPILIIVLIEMMQWITSRGSLDIDDLILNVVGVLLGYVLYPLFIHLVEIKQPISHIH